MLFIEPNHDACWSDPNTKGGVGSFEVAQRHPPRQKVAIMVKSPLTKGRAVVYYNIHQKFGMFLSLCDWVGVFF